MLIRSLLVLAGLLAAGMATAFLLYVSVLSLLAVIAFTIGLVAAFVLGYSASSLSSDDPQPTVAIDVPGEIALFTEMPSRMPHLVPDRARNGLVQSIARDEQAKLALPRATFTAKG